MIAVVDADISNTGSVLNMLRRIGVCGQLVKTPEMLAAAERVILPGIGHFRNGMRMLADMRLVDALREAAVVKRKPTLGICLGMQLLGAHSDEGDCDGLGIIPFRCVRFSFEADAARLPIPHMGWRGVIATKRTPMLSNLPDASRFYFVHSYHAILEHSEDALLKAQYGGRPFVAAVQRDLVVGVQFHPEKSHVFGETILKNFVEMPVAN